MIPTELAGPNSALRQVYKAKTEKLRTYVVCSGLVYGRGESDDVFHSLFKDAWHCNPLQLAGDGSNMVPTIHVSDLSSVVAGVAKTAPEQRYVLAVDSGADTLKDIVGAIATTVGTGDIEQVAADTPVLGSDKAKDYLSVDLKLTSSVVP